MLSASEHSSQHFVWRLVLGLMLEPLAFTIVATVYRSCTVTGRGGILLQFFLLADQ